MSITSRQIAQAAVRRRTGGKKPPTTGGRGYQGSNPRGGHEYTASPRVPGDKTDHNAYEHEGQKGTDYTRSLVRGNNDRIPRYIPKEYKSPNQYKGHTYDDYQQYDRTQQNFSMNPRRLRNVYGVDWGPDGRTV